MRAVIGIIIVIVILVIFLIYSAKKSLYWTEWVPANPSCGNGVQKRTCTANSIFKGILYCFGPSEKPYSFPTCYTRGQYVRIVAPEGSLKPLNILDIDILGAAGESLVVPGVATATSSSVWINDNTYFGPDNVIKKYTSAVQNGRHRIAHTDPKDGKELQWIEVNIGSVQPITQIKVTNRDDCCADNILNSHIEIYDSNHTLVMKLPGFTTTQPVYNLPVPAPLY